jgi:exodeoxyribonuclease V beta subunit
MSIFNVLDPELDVCRSLLIEASAGTGKTYSIENIVVRAIMEGDAPPSIRELLVVTFTKAAAKDLKARIKKCLEAKRPLRRIKQALVEFDQALISTIHAFCFKALAENTIGGNSNPDTASSEMVWEVIERHFRVGLKGYSPEQLNILLSPHQNSVTELTRAIIKLQGRGLPFANSLTNEEGLAELSSALKRIDEDLLATVDAYGVCYYRFTTGKTGQPKLEFRRVFEVLAGLKDRPSLTMEDIAPLLENGAEAIHMLAEGNRKPKQSIPENIAALFEGFQKDIAPVLFQLGSYSSLLVRLTSECRSELFRAFEEQDRCDFTYLLYKMERLSSQDEEFRKRLKAQFKMVIIDEFQDTDPVQWKIFHRIFLNAGIPLILVGDPKQSIYAFRSADIYTYLEAAKALPPASKYVLDTNYRSTPGLIRALNHLFGSAPGWIALPFLKTALPYLPVKASPDKKETDSPSLEFWMVHDEGKLDQIEQKYLFPQCLNEILQLQEKGIPLSEMAFLVRDHQQSDRLFQFFSARGLPAYQLRGVDFHKAAVLQDLIYLLRAILSPRNIGHLQAALGTCFFGWTFEQCLELKNCEALASISAVFYSFHHTWKAHGIGRTLQAVLSFEDKLAASQEGRLRYHELIQILEWIATKESVEKLSCDACFAELEGLRDADFGALENLKLRPLAQKNSVPILTLHMSKGLEFEAVFALGVMNRSRVQDEIVTVRMEGQAILQAAKKGSSSYLDCLEESDAEKSRQLYVALTRAKSKLYVPVIEGWKQPAAGTASPIELLIARLEGGLETICRSSPDIALKVLQVGISAPSAVPNPPLALYPPKKIELFHPKRLSVSYSSLAKKGAVEGVGIGAPHDFNPPIFSPHTLPAGAATGELLHELLEKAPLSLLQGANSFHPLLPFVCKVIGGSCFEPWSEVIAQMIFDAFKTPFGGVALDALAEGDVFREIEFMYPLDHAADIPECTHLEGVIKGVIDLFFIYEGKYYLLDWKTNWLGTDHNAYHQEALEQAMIRHRYDLQADLYIRAIQKYLEKVDPRPFSTIFGGVFYHFLRGNAAYVRP